MSVAFQTKNFRPSLQQVAAAELELRRRRKERYTPPTEWRDWLAAIFPSYVTAPFADRHSQLWEWGWAIKPGIRPAPFVAIWPRGGAKSTSAELLTVAIGARQKRKYAWYICETQDQADKHIDTIAGMLESKQVSGYYPEMATRKVGKYGNSRGWRRNRLRTEHFTIDGMGLDSASRGAKVEEDRPDFMIFDDLDSKHDAGKTTAKKIDTLTTSLLPAGSNDLAILAIQNLIIPNGIFSQLADGRAEFLNDRIVSGPYPAVDGLAVEQRESGFTIVAGTATWEGQPLTVCQQQIRDWGLSAFRAEAQHEIDDPPGGMFDHLQFRQCAWDAVPWSQIIRSTVWVDPAVTSTDDSDSMGIQADALAEDGTIYRLWSWEQVTTPEDALRRAILKAVEVKSLTVGVETDQGGDTWKSVYAQVVAQLNRERVLKVGEAVPVFRSDKAGAGHGPKTHRASQMLVDYEQGRIVHVTGTHQTLERALRRFPKTKPFDLVDASYWSWYDLRKGSTGKRARAREY
ncbi:MAG: hypothetical protein O3A51_08470 [Verrucomicrobia bacterium]|nr:hypothetical protein [Verrucomicrobiota bacterium]